MLNALHTSSHEIYSSTMKGRPLIALFFPLHPISSSPRSWGMYFICTSWLLPTHFPFKNFHILLHLPLLPFTDVIYWPHPIQNLRLEKKKESKSDAKIINDWEKGETSKWAQEGICEQRTQWSERANHGNTCRKRKQQAQKHSDKKELVCLKENKAVQMQQTDKKVEW